MFIRSHIYMFEEIVFTWVDVYKIYFELSSVFLLKLNLKLIKFIFQYIY